MAKLILFIQLFSICTLAQTVESSFTLERVKINTTQNGHSYNLNAVFLKPNDGVAKHPLILITHGSPKTAKQLKNYQPEIYMPQAEMLAKLGYAVAILERRGFGFSTEPYVEYSGGCENKNYDASNEATDADLRAGYKYLTSRADVEASKVVLLGQSAGGLAVVEFARTKPAGLRGVINFAGGRGIEDQGHPCGADALKDAFGKAGKTSTVKELWIYSENDKMFKPEISKQFYAAFSAAGGKADFWMAPSYEDDGHMIFGADGISIWKPRVQKYLELVFNTSDQSL